MQVNADSSDGLALAALIVAIVVPLVSLGVSIGVTIWLRQKVLRKSDEANEIARRALDIEEKRLTDQKRAFVQPVRFDPSGRGVVYEVIGAVPVNEVEFEFRMYSEEGGLCRRQMVTPGEKRFSVPDFDGESDLETPGPRRFLARARWRSDESGDWEASRLYEASKQNYSFRPVTDAK